MMWSKRSSAAGRFLYFGDPDRSLDVDRCWKENDLNRLAHSRMQQIGYVLQTGSIVLSDTAENLLCNDMMQEAYLGGADVCETPV